MRPLRRCSKRSRSVKGREPSNERRGICIHGVSHTSRAATREVLRASNQNTHRLWKAGQGTAVHTTPLLQASCAVFKYSAYSRGILTDFKGDAMFTPSESGNLVRRYTVDKMQYVLQHIAPGDPNPSRLGREPYSPYDRIDSVEYDEYINSIARQNSPPVTNRHHMRQLHIVGGGPMGQMAAIELARYARQLGLNLLIFLYERTAYGGGTGVAPATIASHAWLHLLGAFYAKSQPEVTLHLQQSTQRLQELAPAAFAYPPAFTVDMVGDLPVFFEPLGVWYKPVANSVARSFLARWGMRLPTAATLLRISDASVDIRLLAFYLMNEARRLGVNLVPRGIDSLELRGGHCSKDSVSCVSPACLV